MNINIKVFSCFAEKLGFEGISVELPEGASLDHLLAVLADSDQRWKEILSDADAKIALNFDIIKRSKAVTLQPNDEVAFFPPVTGG